MQMKARTNLYTAVYTMRRQERYRIQYLNSYYW